MPEGPLFPSSPGGLTIASLYFKLADWLLIPRAHVKRQSPRS
jgi:hypothetical protein